MYRRRNMSLNYLKIFIHYYIFPKPDITIAINPTTIPNHCSLLNFSLNNKYPKKVDKITNEPFATGKNIALGIIADSERLILIYAQPNTALPNIYKRRFFNSR